MAHLAWQLTLYLNSCRATRSGERNVFGNFLRENGDVLLVTQYTVHIRGFSPDKKAVQLTSGPDAPTTLLYGVEEDILCSPW